MSEGQQPGRLCVQRLCFDGARRASRVTAIVAWADGAVTERTIADLSGPGARSVTVRFTPAARGALLEV